MATVGNKKIYSHNGTWETALDAVRSRPKKVASYQELAQCVGTIAIHNNDCFLFYRGQDCDYQTNRAENHQSRIIASIYRPPRSDGSGQRTLPKKLKAEREKALNEAKDAFLEIVAQESAFSRDFKKWRFLHFNELTWAIFQHYETLPTPLLDITQSLPVACSVPTHRSKTGKVIVYVLGFTELATTVSYSYQKGFELLRLVGLMPEFAKRPLFQEGCLVSNFPQSTMFSENITSHLFYWQSLSLPQNIFGRTDFIPCRRSCFSQKTTAWGNSCDRSRKNMRRSGRNNANAEGV